MQAGHIPTDFDAIAGADAAIEAKGPALRVADDGVGELTSANAPGFGDPLAREPHLVAADIAAGSPPASAADRVYGVVLDTAGQVGHRHATQRIVR